MTNLFNIKIRFMKKNIFKKENYESPQVNVIEVNCEGIICTSSVNSNEVSGHDFSDGFMLGDGTNVWGN